MYCRVGVTAVVKGKEGGGGSAGGRGQKDCGSRGQPGVCPVVRLFSPRGGQLVGHTRLSLSLSLSLSPALI